ncbi:hypothetical protein CXN86_004905, partial [Salmonella enterica subsp. enterica serovar 4,[5],12:i:-]|nr:hypothetical protein [Salmonella enterica subsp. enterica serovar 4,[5],12:i:-]
HVVDDIFTSLKNNKHCMYFIGDEKLLKKRNSIYTIYLITFLANIC